MSELSEVQTLLQMIGQAIQDPTVQGDAELSQLLAKNAKRLQGKPEQYHQVAADLNQALKFWGMGHLHAPEVLNPLYQATIAGTRGRAYQKTPTGFK